MSAAFSTVPEPTAETPNPTGTTSPGLGAAEWTHRRPPRPEGNPPKPLPRQTINRLAWFTGGALSTALALALAAAPADAAHGGPEAPGFDRIPLSSPATEGGEAGAADSPSEAPVDLPGSASGGVARTLPGEDAWVIETIAEALHRQVDEDPVVTNNRTRKFTEVPR